MGYCIKTYLLCGCCCRGRPKQKLREVEVTTKVGKQAA